MKSFGCGLVLVFLGFTTVTMPFIYQAKVLRKWNQELNRYHYVIGCYDFHAHNDETVIAQRTFIENVLKSCNKEATKVIVEDLSSPGSRGTMHCGRFFLGKKGGILSGLGSYCAACTLALENVEYRFCRVIALGPVMDRIRNNLSSCHASLCSTRQTSVGKLYEEITAVMQEVSLYDDNHFLNNYYATCVRQCSKKCKELSLHKNAAQSMADYVAKHVDGGDRVSRIKHLLTFDSILIDAKMVHAIVNTDKEKIVAIAGGTHIDALCGLLEKVGYSTVYENRAGIQQEQGLYNCVGVGTVDNGLHQKPKPISLDFLKEYVE